MTVARWPKLRSHLNAIERVVTRLSTDRVHRPDQKVCANLTDEFYQIRREIESPDTDDAELIALESALLRPYLVRLERFLRAPNVSVIRPVWRGMRALPKANKIAVFGGDDLVEVVTGLGNRLALTIARMKGTPAEEWTEIREARVCVFGFSACEDQDAHASHLFGASLPTGSRAIVVAPDPTRVPFQLEAEPILRSQVDWQERLEMAIEAAVFSSDAGICYGRGATRELLEWLRDASHSSGRSDLQGLAEASGSESEKASLIEMMVESCGARFCVTYPSRPVLYPVTGDNRVFHASPFRSDFNTFAGELERAARSRGWSYDRGDFNPLGEDIVGGIWEKVSCSSLVVIDLTTMSANVLVELGFAQSLGRRVALVRNESERGSRLYRGVANLNVGWYTPGSVSSVASAVFEKVVGRRDW